jgi:hypothetical protein
MEERKLSFDPNIDIQPTFPKKYGILEREQFYKKVSYKGWGGKFFFLSFIKT